MLVPEAPPHLDCAPLAGKDHVGSAGKIGAADAEAEARAMERRAQANFGLRIRRLHHRTGRPAAVGRHQSGNLCAGRGKGAQGAGGPVEDGISGVRRALRSIRKGYAESGWARPLRAVHEGAVSGGPPRLNGHTVLPSIWGMLQMPLALACSSILVKSVHTAYTSILAYQAEGYAAARKAIRGGSA